MLDKASPIPLYYQLEQILRRRIEEENLQPGAAIPSERELCDLYGVSRITIRQAITRLVGEGLLKRTQGKGTFVAKPKIEQHLLQELIGSYGEMKARGYDVFTRVLDKKITDPTQKLLNRLRLQKGEKVIKIDRLRYVDDEPIFWTTAFVPQKLCPNLINEDFTQFSFYEILETKYGLVVARSVRALEGVLATVEEAAMFGIPNNAPMLLMKNTSYLENGTPVTYSKSRFRGDRIRFGVELTRNSVQVDHYLKKV